MALNLTENLIEDAWQLHHQLAERLTDPVSKLLKAKIEMECIGVEQIRWSEFLNFRKDRTLLCLINMRPLEGQLILEISPSVALQIVAQLLNYTVSKEEVATPRPLTSVERAILMQLVNLVLAAFAVEWKQVYPQVDIQFSALEDSPAKLSKAYPNGTALLADIEVEIDQRVQGNLRFCYPPELLRAIQSAPVSPPTSPAKNSVEAMPSPVSKPDVPELLSAIEDLFELYTHRVEQHLEMLEGKIDALSKKRGGRR